MNKLVIANRGTSEIGKSSAIKAVISLLEGKGYSVIKKDLQGWDIKAIFIIDGIRVGIESQGDPTSKMEETMEEFVNAGCDIIVTSCRTKWSTYDKVVNYLGEENGYDVLWAAHYVYQVPNADGIRDLLNARYAQQVHQLIMDRIHEVI